MFEVKVTVDLPGISDAINNLADALRGNSAPVMRVVNKGSGAAIAELHGGLNIDRGTKEENVEAVDPSYAQSMTLAPVEPAPEEPPLVEVPAEAPAPEDQPASAPAKKYTFKQISTAGAKLCADMSKMESLVSLLNTKYGVPAITMIDESRYGELAEDLIGLGAVIEEG